MGMFYGHNQLDISYTPEIYFYNWWAISNANFAPTGWRTPSNDDFSIIESYLAYYGYSGLTSKLLDYYRKDDGSILQANAAVLQSTTEYYSSEAYEFMYVDFEYLYNGFKTHKRTGYGVILIKNDSTNPGTITDYDGNTYNTIKIGDYVFIVEPWRCKHLNNGTEIPYIINNGDWFTLTGTGMCGYNTIGQIFC